MPGEYAEDVGLSAVEEIKRCMLEAMDRFRSEAEKRFSNMCLLNEVFGFLNPHPPHDVNFTELKYTNGKAMPSGFSHFYCHRVVLSTNKIFEVF